MRTISSNSNWTCVVKNIKDNVYEQIAQLLETAQRKERFCAEIRSI